MQFFTRIDPAKKISRFWLSMVTPTLLGGWSLVREWGRIGSPGTTSIRSFEKEQDALKAEAQGIRKRERRGYAQTQDVVSRWSQILATGGNIVEARKRSQIKSKKREDLKNSKQGDFDF
jgi:predicted DNA-binding WGR domain protein